MMMKMRSEERSNSYLKCSAKFLRTIVIPCLATAYILSLMYMMVRENEETLMLQNSSVSTVDTRRDSSLHFVPPNDLETKLKNQQQQQQQQPQPQPQPQPQSQSQSQSQLVSDRPILRAFAEDIDQSEWEIKPLPARQSKAHNLKLMEFKEVSSCKKLPEQWPTDEGSAPTNKDPFLPWIHDVFPTADGKFIQFVAQNKRRCQTGRTKTEIKKFMQPNIALFQHVPVQRVKLNEKGEDVEITNDQDKTKSARYRLTSHEEADEDGVETRFICRFKPSMEETLSVFNFNYDYNTMRKGYKATFTKEGFDNHMIWSSQLLFRCPVPPSLQEEVRLGTSVIDDYASLFVDLIPIRTPPRYGLPSTYLPPHLFSEDNTWDVEKEWGRSHILPTIEDSGRWENIPICKPSLMTYADEAEIQLETADIASIKKNEAIMADIGQSGEKKHKLIACTWTSAAFNTRGGRTFVNDGQDRLRQWLEFNRLVGVDHVYVYDNSDALSKASSLKPITDLFPGFVTRINWPAKVCNNNRASVDNKGERSSQYAADASCRLRFGAHSTWLASFDTDEYLVPLEQFDDLKQLLSKVEKEEPNINVLNFPSKRSKARLQYLNTKNPGPPLCNIEDCFDPKLPEDQTFLKTYNCNIEIPPRKNLEPAEKAVYKTDFVLHFFVHYAAVTTISAMGKPEAKEKGLQWYTRYNIRKQARFVDEVTEGTMLHTKAIVAKETLYYENILTNSNSRDRGFVGIEWPNYGAGHDRNKTVQINGKSFYPNCYPVEWIEKHWSPKLTEALKKRKR